MISPAYESFVNDVCVDIANESINFDSIKKVIDEIIDKLDLHVCNETVRKAAIKLGYSYKKKSLHASEQERPRCQGKTQKLEKTYVGERHKTSGLSGRKRSKHQYDAALCQSMEKPESSR